MRKIRIIGLTGQSGSGKSTVSKFFEEKGFAVINADLLVRELYGSGSPCVKTLSAQFGADILDDKNQIIRPVLAERVFSSKENTELLSSVVHPFVTALMLKKVKEAYNNGFFDIIYDAPQLFESNSDIICDKIISVIADREIRLKRICARDGIDETAASMRINAQLDEEFFKANSDYIIENNSDLHTLKMQIETVYSSVCPRGD